MKNTMRYSFLIGLLALTQTAVHAQALHWLTQPESQLPLAQNDDHLTIKSAANGRYISFLSRASNLVNDDNNQREDLFVHDTLTGTTQIASTRSNGIQPASFIDSFTAPTSDGQWVAFSARGNWGFGEPNFTVGPLYLKNLQTGQIQLLSVDDEDDFFDVNDIHLADDGLSIYFTTRTRLDPLHTSSDQNLYRKDLTDGSYTLLTVSADGLSAANERINDFAVSRNERFIAVTTDADNLLPFTTAGQNAFLLDNTTGDFKLVTVQPNGSPSVFDTIFSVNNLTVSNNGLVAYTARHDDLVSNDNNDSADLFLYDGSTNTRINLDDNGNEFESPSAFYALLNAIGTQLVFGDTNQLLNTDNNGRRDVYAYDVTNEQISLITDPDVDTNSSRDVIPVDISADGSRVFINSAVNLSNSPLSVDYGKIFYYDFNNDQMNLINPVAFAPNTINDRIFNPQTSSDQLSVVYASEATNLTTTLDTDGINDLFLFDRQSNNHQKIGINVFGGFHAISPSGRFVAFSSQYFQPIGTLDLGASHVFLWDRDDNSYTQIEAGFKPSVNDAGQVAFVSGANLSSNDTNIFNDAYIYDPNDSSLGLVSETASGTSGNDSVFDVKISGSATDTWVVFSSSASDMVPADLNERFDVFLRPWPGGNVVRVSQTPTLDGGNQESFRAEISYAGDFIAFQSRANNLTNDDYTNTSDNQAFVYERDTQLINLVSRDATGLPVRNGIESLNVSDSGRYLTYSVIEKVLSEDNDGNFDVYLYDQMLDQTRLVSKKSNNQQSADRFVGADVVEDLMVSPPLVGVLFTGQGDLTTVAGHPGLTEVFLYQQGGPDVNLNVVVNGPGSISGSQGVSCMTDCDYSFSLGTDLTLIASPDVGFVFDRWQSSFDQCTDDTNPCVLTIDREKQLTAVFIDEKDVIFENSFE